MNDIRDNPPDFIRTATQNSYYQQIIDRLEENGVAIKTQDVFSLGALAMNLALIDSCAESIEDDGMMMDVQGDRHVIKKVNPAVALQKEAQTAVRFYFKEFQMSPTSRGNSVTHIPNRNKSESVLDQV